MNPHDPRLDSSTGAIQVAREAMHVAEEVTGDLLPSRQLKLLYAIAAALIALTQATRGR